MSVSDAVSAMRLPLDHQNNIDLALGDRQIICDTGIIK